MKINLKIIAGIVIVIGLLLASFKVWEYFHQAKANTGQLQLATASKKDFAVPVQNTFKDSVGKTHTTVKANQNSFSQSQINNNPAISLGGADTTAQILGIQRKQIESWQSIATTNQQRALKAERKLDSLGRIIHYYQDKHIYIAYHQGKDSSDNGLFDYKKYETISALQYWKRSGWIGPKISYIDFSSDDPHTIISNPKMFSAQQQDYGFGLKLQLKGVYDFAGKTLVPSAWLIGNYKNWEAGYGYNYSGQLQTLKPQASVAYSFNLR